MDNVIINMNNLTRIEKEQLLKLITKANKGSKLYIPEDGEKYWYITSDGRVRNYGCWSNTPLDINSLMIGNCFKTSEEATKEVEKLKVIKELKDYALEHNESEIDWSVTNERKWCIHYDFVSSVVRSVWTYSMVSNTVYFTSSQIADNAIKAIGEKRIEKYYFGIEEE